MKRRFPALPEGRSLHAANLTSLLLKGAEAAAYLWDEFAAAGDLTAAR